MSLITNFIVFFAAIILLVVYLEANKRVHKMMYTHLRLLDVIRVRVAEEYPLAV